MLFSIDTGKYVNNLPHKKDFDIWRKNLSDDDYMKVIDTLNAIFDENEINTAGWIPGSNWDGTVYEPLYVACNSNPTQAGMFLGLIIFDLLMQRQDKVWGFGKYEKNGVPIRSITYFVLDNPPPNKI